MTNRRGRGRSLLALAAVAGLAAACTGTETISEPPDGPPAVPLGDVRLVAFDSCDGLLDWFHAEAGARVGPYGFDGVAYPVALRGAAEDSAASVAPSAAGSTGSTGSTNGSGSSDATSTTNTQEPGIGEPDVAWTDGARVVTVVKGRLQVVDLQSATVTADVALSDSADSPLAPVGLLVDGDHALVIQQGATTAVPAGNVRGGVAVQPGTAVTALTRVELGGEPTVVGTTTVDGQYVDARMVDGVVRTVVRSSPSDLGFVYPSGGGQAALDRAEQVNRQVVATSTLDDWLPSMTISVEGQEGTTERAVDCAAVDHPTSFAGLDVVTVVGLDLAGGAVEPLPSAAVVAAADTVYASSDALYVATTRWPQWRTLPTRVAGTGTATSTTSTPTTEVPQPEQPDQQELRTDVHAFSLPAGVAARYEASGSVPGSLLGQFALSQHEGDLRVASTTQPTWAGGPVAFDTEGGASTPVTQPQVSESRITVLRRDGADLAEVGKITGLGPTEQIRGVRFSGPQAYVVTFRQTDPLFVVDLGDPTAPRVAGELKITGYSAYLQELAPGRVLGIGQDATDTGRTTGFQESLFDVSDPASPQRLAQHVVPYAQSLAESDHHALLWWSPDRLLAVPVTQWGPPNADMTQRTGVLVTRVSDTAIDEVGVVTHPASTAGGGVAPCPGGGECIGPWGPGYPSQIQRALVADGRLVTVSTAGVKVSDLASLADVAWVPLP